MDRSRCKKALIQQGTPERGPMPSSSTAPLPPASAQQPVQPVSPPIENQLVFCCPLQMI